MTKVELKPTQIPEGMWQLANDRTRHSLDHLGFFQGDLYRLLANAYIQGATDVINNFKVGRRRAVEQSPVPEGK